MQCHRLLHQPISLSGVPLPPPTTNRSPSINVESFNQFSREDRAVDNSEQANNSKDTNFVQQYEQNNHLLISRNAKVLASLKESMNIIQQQRLQQENLPFSTAATTTTTTMISNRKEQKDHDFKIDDINNTTTNNNNNNNNNNANSIRKNTRHVFTQT